jgi:hypothetical protein
MTPGLLKYPRSRLFKLTVAAWVAEAVFMMAAMPRASAQDLVKEAAEFQVSKKRHQDHCEQQFTSRAPQLEPLRGKVPLTEMGDPDEAMRSLNRLPDNKEKIALQAYFAAYLECMHDLTKNVLKRTPPNPDSVNDPSFEPLGMIVLLRDGKISFADFNVRLTNYWEYVRSPPAPVVEPPREVH